ncbi:hypothetical protein HDU86_002448 [Geranomyces michiganensis]|nr:hypothetical protein HDU86_002448 [Geranomyces michiganensis]
MATSAANLARAAAGAEDVDGLSEESKEEELSEVLDEGDNGDANTIVEQWQAEVPMAESLSDEDSNSSNTCGGIPTHELADSPTPLSRPTELAASPMPLSRPLNSGLSTPWKFSLQPPNATRKAKHTLVTKVGGLSHKRRRLQSPQVADNQMDSNSDDNDNEQCDGDAPALLQLEENEKLRDDAGNVVNIETRGERHHQKMFFWSRDIRAVTGVRLHDTVTRSGSAFARGFDGDYVFLSRQSATSAERAYRPAKGRRSLFLTYKGLVRVLHMSQSPIAKKFRDWAAQILQVAQCGTEEQRVEQAAALIGVGIDDLSHALKSFSSSPSCIYLLRLGTVATLRKPLGITATGVRDDDVVVKWGRAPMRIVSCWSPPPPQSL